MRVNKSRAVVGSSPGFRLTDQNCGGSKAGGILTSVSEGKRFPTVCNYLFSLFVCFEICWGHRKTGSSVPFDDVT